MTKTGAFSLLLFSFSSFTSEIACFTPEPLRRFTDVLSIVSSSRSSSLLLTAWTYRHVEKRVKSIEMFSFQNFEIHNFCNCYSIDNVTVVSAKRKASGWSVGDAREASCCRRKIEKYRWNGVAPMNKTIVHHIYNYLNFSLFSCIPSIRVPICWRAFNLFLNLEQCCFFLFAFLSHFLSNLFTFPR